MIEIIFPDGNQKQFKPGITPLEIAESISKGLARKAIAAKINTKAVDLNFPLSTGGELKILSFEDPEGKEVYWHSTSHLMAQAVKRIYPNAKLGVGPAIENGFYYDIEIDQPITQQDLSKIEEIMSAIVKEDLVVTRRELTRNEAIDFFKQKHEDFKVEIVSLVDANDTINAYSQGEFTDLCRGPHVPSTGYIKYFKLLNVAGAYWHGDQSKQQLSRIYGISFPEKKQLDDYLFQLEEAKRRDHRKLGKELELFVFHDISPGSPFWLPNGMIIFRELERYLLEELAERGYVEISTPIMVKKDLWEQSGHWSHYSDNMFKLEADNTVYSLKPMNCPESTYAYKMNLRSYRDLPLRFAEFGRLHRNEVSGALGGMFRVRQITMDDAHIFCRRDQMLDEINGALDLINSFYRIFNFKMEYSLATRPKDGMGDPALWEEAEKALKEALEKNKFSYNLKSGDGAFYGPKIDIQIKDALGRMWQLATVQLDFVMLPERFDLEYIAEDGSRQRPVAIHRAITGSFERFVGILTEHFAGAFPLWLSPLQVMIIPITERQHDFAHQLKKRMQSRKIRVQVDERNEKMNYKIREAENKKVPYMVVVGDKEVQGESVSVRQHKKGDLGSLPVEDFIETVVNKIKNKEIE